MDWISKCSVLIPPLTVRSDAIILMDFVVFFILLGMDVHVIVWFWREVLIIGGIFLVGIFVGILS